MRTLVLVFVSSLVACSSDVSGPPCDGPDTHEPNESPADAHDLGTLTDDPDSTRKIDLTVHTRSDVDFFRFNVKDQGFGGDPIVTVSAPEGYEVTTWFTCARGNVKSFTCLSGKEHQETSVSAGRACQNEQPSGAVSSTADCDADDSDDGEVLLRVKRLDTSDICASKFDITVEVR